MKLYSKTYNGPVKFGNEVLNFENGVVDVEDEVANEILKEGYAYISSQKEKTVAPIEEQLSTEFTEIVKDYENNISRLNGIIVAKESVILTLKKEVENWKEEYLKLSKNPGTPIVEVKDGEIDDAEKIENELRAEFSSLTKENIVALLSEKIEGFDVASVRTLKKDELIEYAIKNL